MVVVPPTTTSADWLILPPVLSVKSPTTLLAARERAVRSVTKASPPEVIRATSPPKLLALSRVMVEPVNDAVPLPTVIVPDWVRALLPLLMVNPVLAVLVASMSVLSVVKTTVPPANVTSPMKLLLVVPSTILPLMELIVDEPSTSISPLAVWVISEFEVS